MPRANSRSPRRIIAADAPRGPMPHHVRPMLATLTDSPFDRSGWLFELKWDGFRAIAEITRGKVALYSRNQKSLHIRFPPIVDALADLRHEAVLDGEVVALDEHGQAQFQLLQNYQSTGRGQLVYYVFDLLYVDGRDVRILPLTRRKELLAQVIRGLPLVRLSEHIETQGQPFYSAAARRGLEGIMAKNGASPYKVGARSLDWLKIKTHKRQEAVIGGYTEPRKSRRHFGALLLGVYEGDELIYVGHTGGGFNAAGLEEMYSRLKPLQRKQCPFVTPPKPNAPAHWVEPKLVCEVKFQEWTGDGRMRMPIFLGLRDDKPARSVRREVAVPAKVAGTLRVPTPRHAERAGYVHFTPRKRRQ